MKKKETSSKWKSRDSTLHLFIMQCDTSIIITDTFEVNVSKRTTDKIVLTRVKTFHFTMV